MKNKITSILKVIMVESFLLQSLSNRLRGETELLTMVTTLN